MDGEKVLYNPSAGNKPMFNSPELSDVRFIVEGQTVYGHKLILAMSSPVFKSMFFGELKEQREVIEIKDLTLAGFKNALSYIYGFEIDYKLSKLYESYLAGDKYLLNHFGKSFFDYVKRKLNPKSSCVIYDQLIKIGERPEIPLAEVRTVAIEQTQETFESEYFKHIDQETLISLLSLDELSIDEFDLLAPVSKWVDCEVQRQGLPLNNENRRKVFEPIKGYVLFSSLKPEKVANCEEIAELLTLEEIGSLVLHLNLGKPLMIEQKTSRSAGAKPFSVFVSSTLSASGYSGSRAVYLTVNRSVRIRALHLTYSENAPYQSFQVQKCSTGANLDLKTNCSVKDGKLRLSFTPPFDVEPNQSYRLDVTCSESLKSEDQHTSQQSLSYGSTTFSLHPLSTYSTYSFVRGLEFVPLD